VCAYHPTVALFPPYRERPSISPQRRRTVAVAKSFFSRAGLTSRSLFGPGDQSGPGG
jgi:hypothetical protein